MQQIIFIIIIIIFSTNNNQKRVLDKNYYDQMNNFLVNWKILELYYIYKYIYLKNK